MNECSKVYLVMRVKNSYLYAVNKGRTRGSCSYQNYIQTSDAHCLVQSNGTLFVDSEEIGQGGSKGQHVMHNSLALVK